MTTTELLDELAAQLVMLRAADDELKLSALHKPPEHLLEALSRHKTELLRHLSHVAPGGETVRVASVKPAKPGMAAGVVWEWEAENPQIGQSQRPAAENDALRSRIRPLQLSKR